MTSATYWVRPLVLETEYCNSCKQISRRCATRWSRTHSSCWALHRLGIGHVFRAPASRLPIRLPLRRRQWADGRPAARDPVRQPGPADECWAGKAAAAGSDYHGRALCLPLQQRLWPSGHRRPVCGSHVANVAVYSSPQFLDFRFDDNRSNFSVPVQVVVSRVSIVAPAGARISLEFDKHERNVQLLLPLHMIVTCSGEGPCLAPPEIFDYACRPNTSLLSGCVSAVSCPVRDTQAISACQQLCSDQPRCQALVYTTGRRCYLKSQIGGIGYDDVGSTSCSKLIVAPSPPPWPSALAASTLHPDFPGINRMIVITPAGHQGNMAQLIHGRGPGGRVAPVGQLLPPRRPCLPLPCGHSTQCARCPQSQRGRVGASRVAARRRRACVGAEFQSARWSRRMVGRRHVPGGGHPQRRARRALRRRRVA